jgi:hypothetical protein
MRQPARIVAVRLSAIVAVALVVTIVPCASRSAEPPADQGPSCIEKIEHFGFVLTVCNYNEFNRFLHPI